MRLLPQSAGDLESEFVLDTDYVSGDLPFNDWALGPAWTGLDTNLAEIQT